MPLALAPWDPPPSPHLNHLSLNPETGLRFSSDAGSLSSCSFSEVDKLGKQQKTKGGRASCPGAVCRVMGVTQPAFPSSLLSLPSASASLWAQHSILSCALAPGCLHHPDALSLCQLIHTVSSIGKALPPRTFSSSHLVSSTAELFKRVVYTDRLTHLPFIPVCFTCQ